MTRRGGRGLALSLGLGLAVVAGCFDGKWLALEPCTKKSECGRGQDCVEGLCLECVGGVCGPYACPVDEVDGECPCPGRAKYECHELSSTRTNKVDILFVLDNSPGSDHVRVVQLEQLLLESLDANLVDYRVAMTTTDSGNPRCSEAATTPEHGNFVFGSCRERLDDFVASDGMSDATADCLDTCVHETIEAVPTGIDDSDELSPRPWLEVSPSGTNLSGDVPVDEALACLILPGVGGCTFESPLESLYRALDRASTPSEPNYGFIRDDAHLMVVIFTNDADCSYNPDYAEIFTEDGDKTFWSDPAAESSTPAVCWNAGVECLGGPSPYYDCVPVDKSLDGSLTLDESTAVLHPLTRYFQQLEAIKIAKQERNPGLEVVVTAIVGVPEDYDEVPLVYESVADTDPEFEDKFGIGPGCSGDATNGEEPVMAVPPVRMLELAAATQPHSGANNVHSICEDELTGALGAISDALDTTVPAQCMPACVADAATCELASRDDGETQTIPRCAGEGQPELGGKELCFYTIEGPSTSPECRSQGWNVQFGFLNTVGVEIPERIFASCAPSTNPEVDCSAGA